MTRPPDDATPDPALLNRIRSEFLEMPGLRLTPGQAQRLYGIEQALCQRALERLVDSRFLCIKPDGRYARTSDGADAPRPTPAKVMPGALAYAAKIPA
jgi:hypothetical protein